MNNVFKNFKKDLACNITLIMVLVFSLIHFLLLILNLFGVLNLGLREDYNYVIGFVMIVGCLALYVLGFFVTFLKRIAFPVWLRICFYVALFVFTNIFYIFGLHNNIYGIMVLFAYLSFLVNIVSVSVFYNIQKDDKYRLKTSKNFIVTSVFLFSLGSMFVLELISCSLKAFVPFNPNVATIPAVVVELASMLFVSIVMLIIFDQSLNRQKKFINACLVKTYAKPEPSPSAKNN